MVEFNCTVKDIFRRPNMIDKAVRELADNGFTDHAVIYAHIRDNIFNALAYASAHLKDYEYNVAISYLQSRNSEQTVAKQTYYTHRTIRRYVRKACAGRKGIIVNVRNAVRDSYAFETITAGKSPLTDELYTVRELYAC